MKCLIIDEMHASIHDYMATTGVEYDYMPNMTPKEVFEEVGQYDGLILRSKMKITPALLEKATSLKFIARAGAGVDEISEETLLQLGITLINAPEGNRDAVGEHALGMLLCLFNKINLGDAEIRQKMWRREANRGIEIKGKTVGIIGYGNMGQAFAQRLVGFECKVLAYDNRRIHYGNAFAKACTLEELFEKTDILSLHIPLNAENYALVNEEFLSSFRKNIYLINTARGPVVPLATLVGGIKSGKLLGAALDVLENENFATLTPEQDQDLQWLFQQQNVLFTPHVGGWTFESYERINQVLAEKIKAFLEGRLG